MYNSVNHFVLVACFFNIVAKKEEKIFFFFFRRNFKYENFFIILFTT